MRKHSSAATFEQIRSLEKCHNEMSEVHDDDQGNRGEGEVGEEDVEEDEEDAAMDSDDEEEGQDLVERADAQRSTFGMTESCWEAVETAICNQISIRKEANVKELELPDKSSSKIARYNPKAHFRFASEEANANVDCLLDSLLNCKLRSRPTNYSKENPVRGRVPFQLRTYDNSGFDVDGDLIAMCGDMYHNEVRDQKNFVGFQKVPYPVNLDSSKTLCELRDINDSNEPWDTNTIKQVYKDGKRKKEWFENCIPDSEQV